MIFEFVGILHTQKGLNEKIDNLLMNEYNNIKRAMLNGDKGTAQTQLLAFHRKYMEIAMEAQRKVAGHQLNTLMLLWADHQLYHWGDWNMFMMRYVNEHCSKLGIPPLCTIR